MNSPFIIPVVAIIMGCLVPIVVMITDYRKKRAIYELHHRERMAAIDKGMELPPLPAHVFGDAPQNCGPANYLLRGLIWSAIGIGMFVALAKVSDEEAAYLGAIPLAIGIAYLAYYAIEGRKLVRSPGKDETSTPAPGS